MTLREKNQNFMQRYHALLMPLLLALLSYAGVDGYGKVQEYRNGQTAAPVTVNVEAPADAAAHSHPDKVRTNAEIDARITAARKAHLCNDHGIC